MSKPGKVLKGLCKKLGVRLTVKRGQKRVYKSIAVLKRQCANKKKVKKKKVKKKKVKRKRRRKFGGQENNQEFLLQDLREEQLIFLEQLVKREPVENPLTENYIQRELMTTFKNAFKAKHSLTDSQFNVLRVLFNKQEEKEEERKREEERLYLILQRKKNEKAGKIQALFRGENTRRRLKELKEEEKRKRQEEQEMIQRRLANRARWQKMNEEIEKIEREEEILTLQNEQEAVRREQDLRRQEEEYANMGFFTGLSRGDAPTIANAVTGAGILGTAAVGRYLYNLQQKKKVKKKVKKKSKNR